MPRRLWHYKDAPRPEQRCACRQLVAGRSVAVCAIAGCPQPQPLMGEIDAGRLAANSAMTRARAYVECVEHSICRVHECLYDASGNVLAVVEAKRCSRHAREADEQLRH